MGLDPDILALFRARQIGPGEAMRRQCERNGDAEQAGRLADAIKHVAAQPREAVQPAGTPYAGPIAAYMPYSLRGDLGAEYNRIMGRLAPAEWALFIDHDALMLTNDAWPALLAAIGRHPDAGAFCCYTNRTGNPLQKTAHRPPGDDIAEHARYAGDLFGRYGHKLTDVTGDQLTGVWFATSREAWQKAGGFVHGFGEVDNGYARSLRAAGLRTYRLDGVYVYHQRRTNGWRATETAKGVSSDLPCRKTSWQWQRARPLIEARSTGTIAELYAAHCRAVEARTDWGECQKNARRRVLLAQWRQTMSLSVVIPAREEPPDELAGTVAAFNSGGGVQVIVVDDGSTEHPVSESCGADLILRNGQPSGVAFSRNRGLAAATGNVIGFSDSHCRIAQGDLLDWAFEAFASEDLFCAVCGSYDNPETWYYGTPLLWRGWRFDVRAHREKTLNPAAPFGSVYCASRWTWERIGGWMPTRGWGYNEQALGLACQSAGVPVRVEPWFRIRHKFRNDRKFPFALSGLDSVSNAPWVHRLIFGEELYRWFFRPAAVENGQQSVAERAERWAEQEGPAVFAKYAGLQRVAPRDILARLGCYALVPPFPTETAEDDPSAGAALTSSATAEAQPPRETAADANHDG